MKFQKVHASKRRITISDIETGSLFIYNGKVYMKLDRDDLLIDQEHCDREGVEYVALDLENGTLVGFEEGITCDLLNKEIVITYDNGDIKEWI